MNNARLINKITSLEVELRKKDDQLYSLIEKGRESEEEARRLAFKVSTLETTIEDLRAKIAELEARLK